MTSKHAKDPRKWLRTAQTISEALPFMRRYSGRKVVIKYGGHAMGDADLADKFAHDIVLLKQVGISPIVVHGGGPQIGEMLKRLAVNSEFVDGLRVTDAETVEIVEMVLSGKINKSITAAINKAGGTAVGVSGKDGSLIKASKLQRTVKDQDSNIEKVLDLGFVGEPEEINPDFLLELDKSGMIPVIAPIGYGPNGETYNINADTAAGAIAAAVGASRLLLMTDVAGVLDKQGTLISELTIPKAEELTQDGTISGGMIPKLETCLESVRGGVDAAVILDGRIAHSMLLEIFTDCGIGTMIKQA
ncbi:acetylglutamate kinase [Kiloniella majae]|uniref:acetylglutamate kinase n=1 Tax=Kiloniella majae TaxID=1938558 RepID=UPI000A2782A7|nr:acetylglutamate kinase [Kiloniella majae]